MIGRRDAIIAASLAACVVVAAPGQAQAPGAPTPNPVETQEAPAAPGNPAAQNPAAQNPAAQTPPPAAEPPNRAAQSETPAGPSAPQPAFADVFAQLAGRLSGVVVNISTQAGPPAPGPGQDQAQNSPGKTLDEVFRDFFGDKGGGPTSPGPRAASHQRPPHSASSDSSLRWWPRPCRSSRRS